MDLLGNLGPFVDPLSILIVFGGSLGATLMRSTGEDIARAFASLGPLLTASPARDEETARFAVSRIAVIAELRGPQCADRIETAGRFLAAAARRLSDSPQDFARWCEEELAARRRRHQGAIGFWAALADAAPGMGLIGTVIALIRMFAGMDDPATIGPAMALALSTTLYGALIANLIAGPIAARLERLSAAELAWQESALARLRLIAERDVAEPAVRLPLRRAS